MTIRKVALAGLGSLMGSLALTACGDHSSIDAAAETAESTADKTASDAGSAIDGAAESVASAAGGALKEVTHWATLKNILDDQPDAVKARYDYRHPSETIRFFDIEPGETVIEALPGGGWYTKILLEYLGTDGKLIGADYSVEMWPLFGGFATEEFVEGKKTWVQSWTEQASGWGVEDAAAIAAYQMGSMPSDIEGTVDTVLFIRALHNLTRFEGEGGFRTTAIAEAYRALKPGGIVGVVQHRARDEASDEWADGSNGYVKTSAMVAAFEAAGFELVDSAEINANPKDQPTTDDVVWRLPPNYATSGEDEDKRAEMAAIGESDRMTLKFRKPV